MNIHGKGNIDMTVKGNRKNPHVWGELNFKNASVNFSTCKVSYESEKSFTLEELNKIIKEIEPDAYLTENKVDNVKKEFHLSIFLIAIIISAISYFFDLPKNVSSYCHDINQDIADYLNISDKEAFDLSREELLDKYNITVSGNKHNSLYDAIVIKKIYELIRGE